MGVRAGAACRLSPWSSNACVSSCPITTPMPPKFRALWGRVKEMGKCRGTMCCSLSPAWAPPLQSWHPARLCSGWLPVVGDAGSPTGTFQAASAVGCKALRDPEASPGLCFMTVWGSIECWS